LVGVVRVAKDLMDTEAWRPGPDVTQWRTNVLKNPVVELGTPWATFIGKTFETLTKKPQKIIEKKSDQKKAALDKIWDGFIDPYHDARETYLKDMTKQENARIESISDGFIHMQKKYNDATRKFAYDNVKPTINYISKYLTVTSPLSSTATDADTYHEEIYHWTMRSRSGLDEWGTELVGPESLRKVADEMLTDYDYLLSNIDDLKIKTVGLKDEVLPDLGGCLQSFNEWWSFNFGAQQGQGGDYYIDALNTTAVSIQTVATHLTDLNKKAQKFGINSLKISDTIKDLAASRKEIESLENVIDQYRGDYETAIRTYWKRLDAQYKAVLDELDKIRDKMVADRDDLLAGLLLYDNEVTNTTSDSQIREDIRSDLGVPEFDFGVQGDNAGWGIPDAGDPGMGESGDDFIVNLSAMAEVVKIKMVLHGGNQGLSSNDKAVWEEYLKRMKDRNEDVYDATDTLFKELVRLAQEREKTSEFVVDIDQEFEYTAETYRDALTFARTHRTEVIVAAKKAKDNALKHLSDARADADRIFNRVTWEYNKQKGLLDVQKAGSDEAGVAWVPDPDDPPEYIMVTNLHSRRVKALTSGRDSLQSRYDELLSDVEEAEGDVYETVHRTIGQNEDGIGGIMKGLFDRVLRRYNRTTSRQAYQDYPTVENNSGITCDGTGAGTFTSELTGLSV